MIAWGRRVRGLRKANRRMRRELSLSRVASGTAHKSWRLAERELISQGQDAADHAKVWSEHRDNLERRLGELISRVARLEQVPPWLRWLFKAL